MSEELRIALLGRATLALRGQPLTGLTSSKARALLIYLAVTARPHTRGRLAALLWPDVLESSARSSLRTTLMRLRKSIGSYLVTGLDSVGIDPEQPLWLDSREFENACNQLLAHKPAFADHERQWLRQAVHLYDDDFLADFQVADAPIFEEWVVQQREHYRRLALTALESLAAEAMQRGSLAEGIEDALRITALDPTNEVAHTLLMQMYALKGQSTQALRQYHEYGRLLQSELDLPPSQEATTLYETIKQGRFLPPMREVQNDTLAASATPANLEQRAHNLPRQTTPFIGRVQELAQIRKRLADPSVRLLTIVGLGGMGKTRLALEAAGRERGRFADGVWFVALAAIEQASLVSSTIAHTLNLPDYGESDPDLYLLRHLADKQMLLILDNLEHLLDAADFIARLLFEAPGIQVIVTARERLRLQEEWLLPLAGLEVPRLDELNTFDPVTHSAVELFVQQARRLSPSFADSPANMVQITHICQLVDGMPLGIELAVSWLRTIPLVEIAGELQAGLDFLSTSLRDVPAPHRSMRAVFDRSWRLLDEREQQTLAGLSVCRGGFTRDAAEKIVGASVSLLAHLIDSSWVQMTASERYALHELVRQYVAEKLDAMSDRTGHLQRLHADYFGALAKRQSGAMGSAQQKRAIDILMSDLDNIRTGWQWAVSNLDVGLISQYGECLKWLAETRALYSEVVPELRRASIALRGAMEADSALPLSSSLSSPLERSELSFILGQLLFQQAHLTARSVSAKLALPLAEEALELLRPHDFEATDERGRRAYLEALTVTCRVARMVAEYEQAVNRSRELIHLASSLPPYQTLVAHAFTCLGNVAHDQGRFEEARLHYGESMAYAGGDALFTCFHPVFMVLLSLDLGELAEATRMLALAEEAMEESGFWTMKKNILYCHALIAMRRGELGQAGRLLAQIGDVANETTVVHARWLYLFGRADLARLSGQPAEAQHFYGEAVELSERVGRRQHLARASLGRAFAILDQALLDQELFEKVRQCFIRALEVALEIGVMPQVVGAVVGLAALQAHQGDPEQARQWLAVAISHPACLYATKVEADRILAHLQIDGSRPITTFLRHPNPEVALKQIVAQFCC